MMCTFISLCFYNDNWIWPNKLDLLFMVSSGILGFIAQICLTKSFQLADASLLAPLDFSSVIWSFFLGYLARIFLSLHEFDAADRWQSIADRTKAELTKAVGMTNRPKNQKVTPYRP